MKETSAFLITFMDVKFCDPVLVEGLLDHRVSIGYADYKASCS